MPLPTITMTGNLTRDPELRFTAGGVPVVTLRIACSDRVKQADGSYTDGASTYLDVSIWRGAAETCAQELRKGDRVTIVGVLKQEDYEKDGQKRTSYKVEAYQVAKTLKPTGTDRKPPRATDSDPWAPVDDIPAF